MSDEPTPLGAALGRVPTGLYIVSTKASGEGPPMGFLGSFVMQMGIDPPVLAVGIGVGRDHLAAIRASGFFAVSILGEENRGLMGAFFKKYGPGESAFDGLATASSPSGAPVLTEALAWLECRVSGEHEPIEGSGDHVVVFGEVVAGEVLREGVPAIHLRRSGLGY